MPTSWTEDTVAETIGWAQGVYPPGTQFVLIEGVLVPVDSDGNPAYEESLVDWTENTVQSTTLTEATVASTTFTETAL